MTVTSAFLPRSCRVLAAFLPRSCRVLAAFLPRSCRVLAAFLAVCLCCTLPVAAAPEQTPSKSQSQPPAFIAVRSELFVYLEKQTGAVPSLPEIPEEKLVLWFYQRQDAFLTGKFTDQEALTFAGQNLRIAEELLKRTEPKMRAQGLLVASETASVVIARLPAERWVAARIYEGFVLPFISLAHVELWQDPSRQRLIEAASGAFALAKEPDKQIKMLEWLLALNQQQKTGQTQLEIDQNTLDWARGSLAGLLFRAPDATRPDVERALSLLQAIESPNMTGYKHLQTQVQARLDQLDAQKTS